MNALRTRVPAASRTASKSFSITASRPVGILSKDKNDPIDPSKESSDSIDKAKNQEGPTPAQQHAQSTGHPVNESSGNPKPSSSQSSQNSPGLGSKHAEQGKKPGEEAVNPAVPKS